MFLSSNKNINHTSSLDYIVDVILQQKHQNLADMAIDVNYPYHYGIFFQYLNGIQTAEL